MRPRASGLLALFGTGCLCLLLLALVAPGADAQVRFDTWTTENGLPQNSVNDIIQTRDGYLWLATFGGLVRFDGARFVVFDRSVEGIGSQRVRALLEHSDGTLWAATDDGMVIRHRDNLFTTYGPADGVPNAEALRIDEGADGSVWVMWVDTATRDGVMTRHAGAGIVAYRRGDLPRDVGQPSHGAGSRDVWWSRDATGLHCLLRGQVTRCVPGDVLPAGDVIRVSTDDRDNIWVQVKGAGVLKVSPEGSRLYTAADGVTAVEAIVGFFEDRQGTAWFVRPDGGLFVAGNPRPERLTSARVLRIFQDHEGSIWLGSTLGLHRIRRPAIAMRDEADGLSSNLVYSMLQSRTGAIWIGTWGGGVNRYEEGRFTSYREAQGLPSGHVTSMHEDRSGRLWVGTTGGLTTLTDAGFRRYADGEAAPVSAVWAIHEDRSGTLWFATSSGLVSLREGRVDRYSSTDGLPHDRVTALADGRTGTLWIGTFQGLARLDDGVFATYTERDGLVGNWVRALHEDADGVLWIGTYDGGLYRLKDDRLTRYTTKNGLHDNGVFQILEDDFGYLWMGSNRGISRVSRRELNDFAEGRTTTVRARAFGTRDGMSTLECNGGRQPAGLKTADGRLWFPTMGGVAIVDPRAVERQVTLPPVNIEEVLVAGQPVDRGGDVTVPRDASTFEVRYTAVSFGAPDLVRFRHRLEGLDEGWTDAGNRRAAAYHRIPPGTYRFLVAAANEGGEWNTTPQSLSVVVIGPFWRKPWFVGLVVVAALFAGVLVDRRRVTGHLRERARQAAFAQRLIETQEGERQRISTELHDALGQELFVIRARVRAARQHVADGEPLGEALDAISTVAHKASEGLKEIAHDLRPYHLDKIGLPRTVEDMIRHVSHASSMTFDTDIAEIDDALEPRQRINAYRIVQECVSNVVKHSGATRALIAIAESGGLVELRVEDDGRGLPSDAVEGANRGLGLMTIRERARALGGHAEVRSATGKGTTVLVRFPLARRRHG